MQFETVWEFETPNFRAALSVAPECDHPADSFEFEEDIETILSGAVEWFHAQVAVYGPDGEELAASHLGGCAYATVEEFYTSHRDQDAMNRNCSIMRAARGDNVRICHYFPGMVAEAISEARGTFKARQAAIAQISLRH